MTGQELRHQADPDAEGHGVPQPDHGERHRVEHRRQEGEQSPGVQVAAGLVDGQLPRVQYPLLAVRSHPAADGPPHARAVGHHVEGQQRIVSTCSTPPSTVVVSEMVLLASDPAS